MRFLRAGAIVASRRQRYADAAARARAKRRHAAAACAPARHAMLLLMLVATDTPRLLRRCASCVRKRRARVAGKEITPSSFTFFFFFDTPPPRLLPIIRRHDAHFGVILICVMPAASDNEYLLCSAAIRLFALLFARSSAPDTTRRFTSIA